MAQLLAMRAAKRRWAKASCTAPFAPWAAENSGYYCTMFRALLALAAGLLLPDIAAAQQRPQGTPGVRPPAVEQLATMQFSRGWSGGNYNGAEWIVGDGPITASTPADFRRFLEQNGSYASVRHTVVLNSPGGNLMAALELGMLIRERRFNTAIGRTVLSQFSRENPTLSQTQSVVQGTCVSACAYAFLGGVDRRAQPGQIGFHQFYSPSALQDARARQFSAVDLGATQALVGLIALYLKEVGVDSEVLFLAATQGPGGMAYPPEAELRRLRIVNTSFHPIVEPWMIEPVGAGAVVTNRSRYNNIREERIALHCRRSSPDTVVLRGAWTYGVPDMAVPARSGINTVATQEFRSAIHSTSLFIGSQEVRRHPGTSGLLEARVDVDGTYRIAFVLSMEEVRLGLARGFSVSVGLPRSLGFEASFTPPLPGLAERLNIALRSCV